jgi:hypothetical protein
MKLLSTKHMMLGVAGQEPVRPGWGIVKVILHIMVDQMLPLAKSHNIIDGHLTVFYGRFRYQGNR